MSPRPGINAGNWRGRGHLFTPTMPVYGRSLKQRKKRLKFDLVKLPATV
jgi:hypothetical protein